MKSKPSLPKCASDSAGLACVLLTGIGLAALPALAEDDADVDTDETLQNILVTGSRTSNIQADIPYTTSVIRLEEIEARNESNVADLLRNLPGIHVTQPSGQGGAARVFVRGGDLENTMVLLDGVRVNDSSDTRGSVFDFSTVNVNDVERIEIVRGPQSAVYGSDALAGVINVISKAPADEFGGSVTAEAGTDDYYSASLGFSGPIGESGGFSLRAATKDDGEPVEGTTFQSDAVTGRLALGSADQWDLQLIGSYSDSEGTSFPEDSGGFENAVLRTLDTRSSEDLRFSLSGGAKLSESWKLNVLATWYDHDASYLSPGVAPGVRDPVPPNGADSNISRTNFAVNAVVDLSDRMTATFGLDHYDEDGESVGFVEFFPGFVLPAGFSFDRRVTGGFGELHYQAESGVTLLASVRHDDSNSESGETTSKVGAMYDFNQGRTTIRANWGQGFSLPGFFALASPLVGNPDLRPETSESIDIGITQRFAENRLAASVMFFHTDFTDLIDFDSTIFRMVNRDEVSTDGVELQLEFAINENLSLDMQATYLDQEIKNSDAELLQRPDWRGSFGVRWSPSEKWLIDGSWLSVGESFDSSIPTGDGVVGSYNRVDLVATYRPTDNLNILLSFDNLLDEDYQEAIGFPAPGLRSRLGLRLLF